MSQTDWYKNPKHPLYFSSDAHDQRVKVKQAADQARKTRQASNEARRLVEQRLGKDLSKTVIDRLMDLISPWDYGIGIPTHRNGAATRYPRKLRRADVYKHLAETSKDDRVYYTCNPLLLGDKRLCMVTVDIDTPSHGAEDEGNAAQSVASDLCQKLDQFSAGGYLCQRSTNGAGYHVTLIVWVPDKLTQRGIRDQLSELRSAISASYEWSSCSEVCVKGLNLIRESTGTSLYGTLVKLPRISSISVAVSFLSISEAPIPLSSLLSLFREKNAENKNEGKVDREERQESSTLVTRGTNNVSLQHGNKKSKTIHADKGSPKARMWNAIRNYQQTYFRNPCSPDELVQHYESLNLHTGSTNAKRLERATEVLQYAQTHYKPLPTLADWIEHLKPLLAHADLNYTDSRRVSIEEAAILGYLIGVKFQLMQQEDIPTSFVKMGSTAMRENGQVESALNCNKKVAKLFRLFIESGIITQTRKHRAGSNGIKGVCRSYARGPNWIGAMPQP